MAIDVSGFVSKPEQFEGLYQAGQTVQRLEAEERQLAQQREAKQLATSKFLTDYLDPKDRLTGTNYDPEIVKQLNQTLQEGAALASKGASTADIMMALGPKVNRINEYSTKAKLINQNIKSQLDKVKAYGGYNIAALEDEAKKMAFQDEKGQLKDISLVDPSTNWITEVTTKRPELVTTGAGLDQFVTKTPMSETERSIQTAYAGRTRNVKYQAKAPFWEDLARDDKGQLILDAAGNPIGMDVISSPIMGDSGEPILDPKTKKPFRAIGEDAFNAIMQHNPDIADYIRGQVNTSFRQAGAKEIPKEGSPQWDMKARNILYDELKTRSKSSFKTIDQQKESGAAVKVEIGQSPEMLQATRNYYDATRKQGGGADKVPKTITYADTISGIMNNEPDFSGGEIKEIDGQNVVDVTSYLPDLKYSKDQAYKNIYRNPQDNSMIFIDQSGKKQIVPENKLFQFMNKHAGYNNLNPEYLRKTMEGSGYESGRFSKAKPSQIQQQVQQKQQEQAQARAGKLGEFEKSGKVAELKEFEGRKTREGTIKKINKTSAFNVVNDYYIEFSDGTEKTFKNKEELTKYLKSGQQQAPQATPAPAKTAVSDWKSRAKKL